MALQDLTLDFENKTISNEFIKGKDLIIQKVILALQCWTGDWFLDGDYGTNYGIRLENKSLLLADMQDIILSVDGVLSVEDLDAKVIYQDLEHKNQRMFSISATIITEDEQQVEMNGLVPIIGV